MPFATPAMPTLALAAHLIMPVQASGPRTETFMSNAASVVKRAVTATFCQRREMGYLNKVSAILTGYAYSERAEIAKEIGIAADHMKDWTMGALQGEAVMMEVANEGFGKNAVCDAITANPGWEAYLAPIDKMVASKK